MHLENQNSRRTAQGWHFACLTLTGLAQASEVPRAPGLGAIFEVKRILVVDDNPSSRELVKFALELEPEYQIEEAADGHDAISRIRRELPDLILMDIQMPEMDGYETLRQIRATPSCKLVPVVAITAFAMLDDRQKAFEAGFDGYFAKPINIAALRTQIDSLLRK